MTHTPGPWMYEPIPDLDSHYLYDSNHILLGEVHGLTQPEADANARLIVAAPELLQACRAALWALTPYPIRSKAGNDMRRADADNAFDSLRSAIAKAEGCLPHVQRQA